MFHALSYGRRPVLAGKGVIEAQSGRKARIGLVGRDYVVESMQLFLRGLQRVPGELPYSKVHEVRRTIELTIVELAAKRASPSHLQRLRGTFEQMQRATDDVAASSRLDVEFHRLMRDYMVVAYRHGTTVMRRQVDGEWVNMDEGRKRLEHMRNDPRVTLTVLAEGDWYSTVTLIGHVGEWREDTDLVDIDRVATHYIGTVYPQRAGGGSVPGSTSTAGTAGDR